MNTPISPFWFKQRQCKAEPAGENTIKVSGPNLGEAYLHVRRDNAHWKASLRLSADGPDVADAALMLGVIAGHDGRDSTSLPQGGEDYLTALEQPLEGLRVGVPRLTISP